MYKYNLKEIFRIKFLWTCPILLIFMNILLLHKSNLNLNSLGLTLQVYLLINVLLGIFLSSKIIKDDINEFFEYFKDNFFKYILNSILSLFILNFIMLLLFVFSMLIYFIILRFDKWILFESTQFYLIYFLLHGIACSLLGFLIGLIFKGKFKFLASIIVFLLISPMIVMILPYVKSSYKITLGPPNLRYAIRDIYGYDVEYFRMFKSLSLILILIFFIFIFSQKLYKNRKQTICAVILGIVSVVLVIFSFQDDWRFRPFYTDSYAERNYDINYYKDNMENLDDLSREEKAITYKIETMDININLNRKADLEVLVKLKCLEDTKLLNGSLYHKFNIESITENGKKLEYKRMNDVFSIKRMCRKGDELSLTFKYSGVSSPIYPFNYKGCVLPSTFNYLPTNIVRPSARFIDDNLVFLGNYSKDNIRYRLKFDSGLFKELVTNLNKIDNNTFEGFSDKGLSIYYGNLIKLSDNLYCTSELAKEDRVKYINLYNKINDKFKSVSKEYGFLGIDKYKFIVASNLNRSEIIVANADLDPTCIKSIDLNSEDIPLGSILNRLIVGRDEFLSQKPELIKFIYFASMYIETNYDKDYFSTFDKEINSFMKMPIHKRKEVIKNILKDIKNKVISKEELERYLGD